MDSDRMDSRRKFSLKDRLRLDKLDSCVEAGVTGTESLSSRSAVVADPVQELNMLRKACSMPSVVVIPEEASAGLMALSMFRRISRADACNRSRAEVMASLLLLLLLLLFLGMMEGVLAYGME
jgi:hypothetical protein